MVRPWFLATLPLLPWLVGARKNTVDRPYCDSDKCYRLAEFLEMSMGRRETINPCTNWDEYACGGFEKIHLYDNYKLSDDQMSYDHKTATTKYIFKMMDKLFISPDGVKRPATENPPDDTDAGLFKMMTDYKTKCLEAPKDFKWNRFRHFEFLTNITLKAFSKYETTYPTPLVNTSKLVDAEDHGMISDAATMLGRYGIWTIAEYGVHKSMHTPDKKSIYIKPWVSKGLPYKELWYRKDTVKEYEKVVSWWLKVALSKQWNYESYETLAKRVVALEREINKISPPEQEWTSYRNWGVMSAEELDGAGPELTLSDLFNVYEHEDRSEDIKNAKAKIDVQFPEYWAQLSEILKQQQKGTVRAWVMWQIYIQNQDLMIDYKPIRKYRDLFARAGGAKKSIAQRDRCKKRTLDMFHHYIGSIYLNRTLDGHSRAMGEAVVNNIKGAYINAIGETSWLSEEGKAMIINKARKITAMTGGQGQNPDIMDLDDLVQYYKGDMFKDGKTWWDEPGAPDETDQQFHGFDVWRSQRQKLEKAFATLNDAPNEYEWDLPAWSTDAGYSYPNNKVMMPAGTFWEPMFGADYPTFVNYAHFGVAAGTEMAHAFDDIGTLVSSDGILGDLLSEQDRQNFNESTQCFREKYNGMPVVAGDPVNSKSDRYRVDGPRILNSIMADTTGADMAYRAWKATQRDHQDPSLPGFTFMTNDQQFWLLRSYYHCEKTRKEAWENMMLNGPHAPPSVRLDEPLRDLESWYESWQCPVPKRAPMCKLYGKKQTIKEMDVNWWPEKGSVDDRTFPLESMNYVPSYRDLDMKRKRSLDTGVEHPHGKRISDHEPGSRLHDPKPLPIPWGHPKPRQTVSEKHWLSPWWNIKGQLELDRWEVGINMSRDARLERMRKLEAEKAELNGSASVLPIEVKQREERLKEIDKELKVEEKEQDWYEQEDEFRKSQVNEFDTWLRDAWGKLWPIHFMPPMPAHRQYVKESTDQLKIDILRKLMVEDNLGPLRKLWKFGLAKHIADKAGVIRYDANRSLIKDREKIAKANVDADERQYRQSQAWAREKLEIEASDAYLKETWLPKKDWEKKELKWYEKPWEEELPALREGD